MSKKPEIARGLGPQPVRITLAGLALVYFVLLLKHPVPHGWIRPLAYFSECTALFVNADVVATEYRVDAWSCDRHRWEALDPRPYFPMRADDKEARFQRLVHFYKGNETVFRALDAYIVDHHAEHEADDGVPGLLGGIRLYQVERAIPTPGSEIERYHYEPRSELPPSVKQVELFAGKRDRKARCLGVHATPAPPMSTAPMTPPPDLGSGSGSGSGSAGSGSGSASEDPWAR